MIILILCKILMSFSELADRRRAVFFLAIARGSSVGDQACVAHDMLVILCIKFFQSEAGKSKCSSCICVCKAMLTQVSVYIMHINTDTSVHVNACM